MHSLRKALEEDYIEEKKDRLYRGQGARTLEKEYRLIGKDRG